MQGIVQKIIDLFGSGIGKEIAVFVISMLPILELRGGLLAASIIGMDFIPAYIISILGNCLPIPFVLIFLDKIFNWLKKFKTTEKIVVKLEKKILSKKAQIEKYGYLGIPLPGTGAWTGAGLAVLLRLDKKKSSIAIFLGVILASIIMSIISYGILDKIIR